MSFDTSPNLPVPEAEPVSIEQEKKDKYERFSHRVGAVCEVFKILHGSTTEESVSQSHARLDDFMQHLSADLGVSPENIVDKDVEEALLSEIENDLKNLKYGSPNSVSELILAQELSRYGVSVDEARIPQRYGRDVVRPIQRFFHENFQRDNPEAYTKIELKINELEKLFRKDREQYLARVQSLVQERRDFLENEVGEKGADYILYKNLQSLIKHMKERRVEVDGFEKGRRKLDSVSELRGKRIVRADYHPYHVNIFVEQGSLPYEAQHEPETPFNLFNGENADPSTIRHEEMHAYLDVMPATEWKQASREFMKIADSFLEHDPKEFLDTPRNEILAQIFEAEEEGFGVSYVNKMTEAEPINGRFEYSSEQVYRGRRAFGKSHIRFIEFAACMATAGMDILEVDLMVNEMKKQEQASGNSEKAKEMEEWRAKFRMEFVGMMTIARNALLVAKEIGPEAMEEVHAAILILKPSQFETHLMPYLFSRFGKETVKTNEVFVRLISDFDLKTLRMFEEVQDQLNPTQKERLAQKLLSFTYTPDFGERLKITSASDLREYSDLVKKVGSYLSNEPATQKIAEGAVWHYLAYVIRFSETTYGENLDEFKTTLNAEERKIFDSLVARKELLG